MKQKVHKSVFKRVKVTSGGKLLKRHQYGSGHLKRNKSKGALNRQKKTSEFFKGEASRLRKVLGL